MGLLSWLFGSSNDEEESTPRFPYRFIATRWNRVARTKGVGGDRNKNLVIIEGGEKKQKYPYAKGHIREAAEKELSMPHLDETGGQKVPGYDKLSEYVPNLISHDQSNLKHQ